MSSLKWISPVPSRTSNSDFVCLCNLASTDCMTASYWGKLKAYSFYLSAPAINEIVLYNTKQSVIRDD